MKEQCYRDYPEDRPLVTEQNAASAAAQCGEASASQSRPVGQIVNAMYHAGVGERLVGEHSATDEAARRFTRAEEYQTQALALREGLYAARLERAWVYYDQRRYPESLAEINQVLREQDNPTNWTHASTHYLHGLVSDALNDDATALSEWEVLTSDALDHHVYAGPARSRIIAVATRLGIAALTTGTRESTQNAIGLFTRAQSAAEASGWEGLGFPISMAPGTDWPSEFEHVFNVDAAGIHTNLGRARLQLAGLTGPSGLANFKCEQGAGAPDALNLARQDFDSALAQANPNTPSAAAANRGKACALLALGRTTEGATAAGANFDQTAIPADSPLRRDWRNWRMRGRAQARAGMTSDAARSLIESARLLASDTTDFVGDRPSELADIRVETADMYFNPPTDDTYAQDAVGDAATAIGYLNEAIPLNSSDSRFAPALVKRGKIRFSRGEFASAQTDFVRARELTSGAGDRFAHVRAEALYYLSRLTTEHFDARNGADSAIRDADNAFGLVPLPLYRQQACLARIHFRRVGGSDQNYCAAAGASAADANAYAFQGMYELRRAHIAYGEGAKNRAWEAAYRAFETGLRMLDATSGGEDRDELRARLILGQATAQSCVGFADIGTTLENSISGQVGDANYNLAHSFFERHHIMTCDGLPPHPR